MIWVCNTTISGVFRLTQNIDEALAFRAPPRDNYGAYLKLWHRYFSPIFSGMENIDTKRPTLFVGNHSRYGMLDVPIMHREIYLQTGVFPRILADRFHYTVPIWKDTIGKGGGVLGSREMCRALMQAGQSIMVFPGGGREVVKGKGTNYQLLWRERLGFVRMAVENGYTITPFSAVGADEAMSVLIDGDDIMGSLIGRMIKASGLEKYTDNGERLFPIPRGIGLTLLPRPERFYFSFDKPIDTASYSGRQDDKKLLQRIQKRTADSITSMMKDAMLQRAQDRDDQSLIRRLLQRS